MHEQIKKWLSIGMISLSGFVLISVFGTPGGDSYPLIPSLVPIFGIVFGFMFAIFQFGYCYYFDIKKGFFWILGIWAVIIPFICLGETFGCCPPALCGFARVITGASCVSALVLGLGVLKNKL